MALWGITDANESKPKWAVRGGVVDPTNIFATSEGWVLRHYKKVDRSEYWDEVLVSVDGMVGAGSRGTDTLAEADITAVFFKQSSFAQADTGTVVVSYNELVNVTAGATLDVTGSSSGAITATYARGTGTNRVEFDFTVPSATQDLSLAAGSITGTIVDTIGGATSDKAFATGNIVGPGGVGPNVAISVA